MGGRHRHFRRWYVAGALVLGIALLATVVGRPNASHASSPERAAVHAHHHPRPVRHHAPAPWWIADAPVHGLHNVSLSGWTTYITSSLSGGQPWNASDGGGSGINAGGYDLEYFEPSHVIEHHGAVTFRATPGSSRPGYSFTSGVLSSYGHVSFDGGYLQVEASFSDTTRGAWPCIWLLSGPGDRQSDEIDLLEGGLRSPGASPNTTFSGFTHTDGHQTGGTLAIGRNLARGVHVYGVLWVPGRSVTWYVDGRRIMEVTSQQARMPAAPMSLVLDVAMASPLAAEWHTVSVPGSSAEMTVLGVQYTPHY